MGPGSATKKCWRVAFGELSQETDTFSPARQLLSAFEANGILSGDELLKVRAILSPGSGLHRRAHSGFTNAVITCRSRRQALVSPAHRRWEAS